MQVYLSPLTLGGHGEGCHVTDTVAIRIMDPVSGVVLLLGYHFVGYALTAFAFGNHNFRLRHCCIAAAAWTWAGKGVSENSMAWQSSKLCHRFIVFMINSLYKI